MEICASLAPICAPDCRVLILGSMPGVASLRAQQYYAHPRNALWPILFDLWDAPHETGYDVKTAFALSRRIAIWDVAKTCLREGSSDASIRDAQPNDIAGLLAACPQIHTIFHNGRLSETLYDRLCASVTPARTRVLLPSTSPAYTLPYTDKLAAWQPVRAAAEKEQSAC